MIKSLKVIAPVLLATSLLIPQTASAGFKSSKICLAKAMYFEARGGSDKDMLAVGHTVMNRVKSSRFPSTVCGVTRQKYQFSPHILKGSTIHEKKVYTKILGFSGDILNKERKDFTHGAEYFHTPAVNPKWSKKVKVVYKNNQHIFYKH